MEFLNSILRLVGNRYFLTFIAFAAWLTFFDNNNLIRQQEMAAQLGELKREKEFYLAEIEQNRIAAQALENDMELLERYAREKYLMKKDNEDIFLIVEEVDDREE
jgi:cell division protein FtsB